MPYFEPVILFFLLGVIAGFVRSDLKIPNVRYELLSIFLLLAIGLKGGVELARYPLLDVALPALAVVAAGALIPLAAYPVLRRFGKLPRADAGSIAAHYRLVSVVTFAEWSTCCGVPRVAACRACCSTATAPSARRWSSTSSSEIIRTFATSSARSRHRRFFDCRCPPSPTMAGSTPRSSRASGTRHATRDVARIWKSLDFDCCIGHPPKMMIVDEVHHLLAGTVREQRQSLNQLKFLSNELRMPVIALGTSEALYAMQADPQIASRFEPFALPRWRESAALREFVVSFGRLLPLHLPSPFGDKDMIQKLT